MKRLPQAILDSRHERAHLLQRASDPDTLPAQLVALAGLADPEINVRIAANPNAPQKTLHALWRVHPLSALENPVLLYWSLRDGSPFRELLPFGVKLSLYVTLRKTGATGKLEEHLPEEERLGWLGQPDAWMACNSAGQGAATGRRKRHNADAGPEADGPPVSEALGFLAKDPSAKVRQKMARAIRFLPIGRECAMRLQEQLARDTCAEVRAGVAASRLMSPELHRLLSSDPEREVQRCLAKNPAVPGIVSDEGWHRLIDAGLAAEVASNRSCPESVKLHLANCGSPEERMLAWTKLKFHQLTRWDAVHAAIETAISDPARIDEVVRIARNPSISGTIRNRLMAHGEVRVTRALATQPHLTEQQLFRLLDHPDQGTALRAAKHAPAADYLLAAAGHPNPMVRALLAKKKGRHPWSLRNRLVDDPDPRVRLALCRSLIESGEETLASDSMGMALIQKLRKDPSARVRKLARTDPRH